MISTKWKSEIIVDLIKFIIKNHSHIIFSSSENNVKLQTLKLVKKSSIHAAMKTWRVCISMYAPSINVYVYIYTASISNYHTYVIHGLWYSFDLKFQIKWYITCLSLSWDSYIASVSLWSIHVKDYITFS